MAELSNRAGISTAVQFRWLQEEYEPTTLERWFVAFDQAEAQWTAAIAPAFVAYASSMAQAAAADTIAQATAANTQSLANLAADHAYQSATEQYFEQAQEDQHDAWFDYLDDWYEQEQHHSASTSDQVRRRGEYVGRMGNPWSLDAPNGTGFSLARPRPLGLPQWSDH